MKVRSCKISIMGVNVLLNFVGTFTKFCVQQTANLFAEWRRYA